MSDFRTGLGHGTADALIDLIEDHDRLTYPHLAYACVRNGRGVDSGEAVACVQGSGVADWAPKE